MKQKNMKGITLIALVITIIVLLILAGVAIATITGENGILVKAVSAKEKTARAEVIEKAKLDIIAMQTDNEGKIMVKDLRTILDNYFKDVPTEIAPEGIADLELTTKDGKYKIKLSEIYNGKIEGIGGPMLVSDLKVGDYVKYGDKLTSKSYVTNSNGEPNTGYEKTQTFNTDTTALWRVMSKKSNGDVEIVATKNMLSSNGTSGLYLKGQDGFLNSETVLNNLCSKLYSNTAYGTARSIRRSDINNLIGFHPETDAQDYNKTYTYTSGGPFWDEKTNSFKMASTENPVVVRHTFYEYHFNESMPLYDTLVREAKENISFNDEGDSRTYTNTYWLADRVTYVGESNSDFCVSVMDSTDWADDGFTYMAISFLNFGISSESSGAFGFACRPVVTLNSSVQIDTSDATKDGSEQGKAWILK